MKIMTEAVIRIQHSPAQTMKSAKWTTTRSVAKPGKIQWECSITELRSIQLLAANARLLQWKQEKLLL